MWRNLAICAGIWLMSIATLWAQEGSRPFGLVIHGGAGGATPDTMAPELQKEFARNLQVALDRGYAILASGGTSVDAVVAAITFLEDCPLFNAGKGAVFAGNGKNELDASIMDGRCRAGAVAGVRRVKNPILLARAVMDHSPHVLLAGEGAEAFAKTQEIELVLESYFFTQKRWDQLEKAREKSGQDDGDWRKFGTVGAVALDQHGHLAAGTSTGGLTNKRFGRVGDSPIIGAGTYADDATCAVSATGRGEYFMRSVVTHDISALMAYRGWSVKRAAEYVVMEKLVALGGKGGVIAIDRDGHITMPFNTETMFRAFHLSSGENAVLLFK